MGKKVLKRLGYILKEEFFKNNNYTSYICNEEATILIKNIKGFAEEVLGNGWMVNHILKVNKTINATNPLGLIFGDVCNGRDRIEFYCHNSLNEEQRNYGVYLLTTQIEKFIKKYEEQLKQYNHCINWDDIEITPTEVINNEDNFLINNKDLIKVLFIKQIALNEIYIGSSEDEKYITDGRKLKFYPCYSYDGGYQLISEVIEVSENAIIEKYCYTITPEIDRDSNTGNLLIYPIIGAKRCVSYNKEKYIKDQDAKSNCSVLIFDNDKYFSPRITVTYDKDTREKGMKNNYFDYSLYKYLEKRGIYYKDIENSITDDNLNNNINLVYSTNSGKKMKIGAGVPGLDKIDICNYILDHIEGLELLPPVDEILNKVKTFKIGAGISNAGKIDVKNCLWRNGITNIDLIILQDQEREISLYDEVIVNLEKIGGLFKNGIRKLEDNSYELIIGDNKINLNIRDVECINSLEMKNESLCETVEDRKEKLLKDIKFINPENITVALMNIKNMGALDAKQIVRNALDELGIINQNIENVVSISETKCEVKTNSILSGIKDLLNDIGLGNMNQSMAENQVIYTLHKIEDINIICRINNLSVEVKIPQCMDTYCHISKVYSKLNKIIEKRLELKKLKTKSRELYDSKIKRLTNEGIEIFIQDIKLDEREVITVFENGEKKSNAILNDLSNIQEEEIKINSEYYVTTDLLDMELIQFDHGRPTKGKGFYKIKDGIYISIGEKVQAEINAAVDSSKIREWKNSKGTISKGYKQMFADRIGYEIKINKENVNIIHLIHNLRLATTSHIHLNRNLTTDYIIGLGKHLIHHSEKNK